MSYVCPALLGELRLPVKPGDVPHLAMLKSSFARPLLNGSQVHLRGSSFKRMPHGVSGYVTITRDVAPALLFWVQFWQQRIRRKRKRQGEGVPTLPTELWEKIIWFTGPTSFISANVYGSVPGTPPTPVRHRPNSTKATVTSQYWSEVIVRDALLVAYPAISHGSVYIQSVNLRRAVKLVAIPNAAFENCIHLKHVLLPLSVVYVGVAAFSGCESLEGAMVLPHAHFVGERAFCNTKISAVEIPALSKIPCSMCCGCESLQSVRAPSAISGSSRMFFNCVSLAAVYMHPDAILDSTCAQAFQNCSNLRQITVSVSAVAAHLFSGCRSLESGVTILSSCASFPLGCFDNCGARVTAYNTVSEFGEKAMRGTGIEYVNCHVLRNVGFAAFEATRLLRVVTLRISNVEGTNMAVGYKAFTGSSVVHVSMELLSPLPQVIGASAFAHCKQLRTVQITARGSVVLSSMVFFNCKALTQVKIATAPCSGHDRVDRTPLSITGSATFGNCASLEQVVLVEAATIAWSTFVGCSKLKTLNMHPDTTFAGSCHNPDMSRHLQSWDDYPGLTTLPCPHTVPIIGLSHLLGFGIQTRVNVGVISVGSAQRFITRTVSSPFREWPFLPITFTFVAKTRYTVRGTREFFPPAGTAAVTLCIIGDVGNPHVVDFVHCGETKQCNISSANLTDTEIEKLAIELFPAIESTAFTCPAVGKGAITGTALVRYILNAPSRAMKRGHRFTFTFGAPKPAPHADYRPNTAAQDMLHTCTGPHSETEWINLFFDAYPFMKPVTPTGGLRQDWLHSIALWRAIASNNSQFRPDLLPGVELSQAQYASSVNRWQGGGYYSASHVDGAFNLIFPKLF